MDSNIVIRNSIRELYSEENLDLQNFLQLPEEELSENSRTLVTNHINYVMNKKETWKFVRFGEGMQWLNTDMPLSFDRELKNKIVILKFFTYCCINCEHVLPIINQVEQKYQDKPELVIIGVHSPKHPNEREKDSVQNALKRNKISHPVINDYNNAFWNALDINCWPTVLVIGPDGKVFFSLIGETAIKKLDFLCEITLKTLMCAEVALNTAKLPISKVDHSEGVLLYPSGISCAKGIDFPKVLVSDTGHNRLLLITPDGRVVDVIGDGSKGLVNGSFQSCSFNSPHGSDWLNEDMALVADTGNNCIRLIDLNKKEVSEFSGENLLASTPTRYENNTSELKSPWDVCVVPGNQGYDTVYIAAAGSHQIWAINLSSSFRTKQLHSAYFAFAGNGKEECRNNHYKERAGFAQPSGICYIPESLYIVDSESSSLRSLSCTDGSVRTVNGGDRDPLELFSFGDEDGEGPSTKFQHPLALCAFIDSQVLLADSYNHKIKWVNVKKGRSFTFAGSGKKGNLTDVQIKQAQFNEPSGICYFNNTVLVTDTNNHCVKVIDCLKKDCRPLTLTFQNTSCIDGIRRKPENPVQCLTARIKPKGQISLIFIFKESGLALTKGSPQQWTVSFEGEWKWSVSCISSSVVGTSYQPSVILKSVHEASDKCSINVDLSFSVCNLYAKTCIQIFESVRVDVELSEGGSENFDALFYF